MAPCAACGICLSGRATLCPACRTRRGGDDRLPTAAFAAMLPAMDSDLTFTEVCLIDSHLPTDAKRGTRAATSWNLAAIAVGCAVMIILLAGVLAGLRS